MTQGRNTCPTCDDPYEGEDVEQDDDDSGSASSLSPPNNEQNAQTIAAQQAEYDRIAARMLGEPPVRRARQAVRVSNTVYHRHPVVADDHAVRAVNILFGTVHNAALTTTLFIASAVLTVFLVLLCVWWLMSWLPYVAFILHSTLRTSWEFTRWIYSVTCALMHANTQLVSCGLEQKNMKMCFFKHIVIPWFQYGK